MNTNGRNKIKHRLGAMVIAMACGLTSMVAYSQGFELEHFEPVYTQEELQYLTPMSADPGRSVLPPGVEPDHDFWSSYHYWRTQELNAEAEPRNHVFINEVEPNNTVAQAQAINLGSQGVGIPEIGVVGTFATTTFIEFPSDIVEENGSITHAIDTGLGVAEVTAASSEIGDGIHGSSGSGQGDFDFYKTAQLPAGVFLEAEIVTFDGGASFSSVLGVYNSAGQLLSKSSRSFGDASVGYRITQDDVYYVCVGGLHFDGTGGTGSIDNDFPTNPFQPGSGGGYGSEGEYNITIRVSDVDYVAVNLVAGDVLSISSESPSSVALEASLEDPAGNLYVSTSLTASQRFGGTAVSLYSEANPFSGIFGSLHAPYVIPETGTYFIAFRGSSANQYVMDLRVLRPSLEITDSTQVVYLNFGTVARIYDADSPEPGATFAPPLEVDLSVFDPTLSSSPTQLSPFFSFMEDPLRFEFEDEDDAEITFYNYTDQITDVVRSIVPSSVQLINSPRPPGAENSASEIIIGGTRAQTNIQAVSVFEAIDPGNYDSHDQSLIMMGDVAPFLDGIPVNFIPTGDAEADDELAKILNGQKIAKLLGNLIVNQIGHILGNFSTKLGGSFDDPGSFNIMDRLDPNNPSTFENLLGLGDDRIFNTFDDYTPTFGVDDFDLEGPFDGGFVDTENVILFNSNAEGVQGLDLSNLYVDYEAEHLGIGKASNPLNNMGIASALLNEGGTINIYTSQGVESSNSSASLEGTSGEVTRFDKPMTIQNATPEAGAVRITGE